MGDRIEKLRIGHDGKGFGAGWHLDKVEIRRLLQSGKVQLATHSSYYSSVFKFDLFCDDYNCLGLVYMCHNLVYFNMGTFQIDA